MVAGLFDPQTNESRCEYYSWFQRRIPVKLLESRHQNLG